MGQKSWNKLFEQEYLPQLVERDNTTDPITGMTKQQTDEAQEWAELSLHDTHKKKPLQPSQQVDPVLLASHTYRGSPLDDDERKDNLRRQTTLPYLSIATTAPESFLKPPAKEKPKLTKKELKEQKLKLRELKNARYANVTQHTDHLVYLHPNMKLGVKHGDSSRMKFPAQEFQDSDLRLKKIKNGKSLINLSESDDSLFPVLYVRRGLSLGITQQTPPLTKAISVPSRQRLDHLDSHKRLTDADLDARLEGELRDEFLSMMETKMNTLDQQLQIRREKREETYKSREMLLKAADTIQKVRENSVPDKRAENIWEKVKEDANNDPNLLVTRLNLYMQIVNFIEQNGGLHTETEELMISFIREELENGSPADRSLLTKVLLEYGMAIINDVQLQDLMQYIGDHVGVSPSELSEMIEYYDKCNLFKHTLGDKNKMSINRTYDGAGNDYSNSVDSYHGNSTRMATIKRASTYFQQPKMIIAAAPTKPISRVKSLDSASSAMPPVTRVRSQNFEEYNVAEDLDALDSPSNVSLPTVHSYGPKARR